MSRALICGRPERGTLIVYADPGKAVEASDTLSVLGDSWRVIVADIKGEDPQRSAAGEGVPEGEGAAIAFAVQHLHAAPMGRAVLVGLGELGSRYAAAVASRLPGSVNLLLPTDAAVAGSPPHGVPTRLLTADLDTEQLRWVLDEFVPTPEVARPWVLPEIAEQLAANPQPPSLSIPAARERSIRMNPVGELPQDCELSIEVFGGVENRVMSLKNKGVGLIIFLIHGGGYVMGTGYFEDDRCADIVRTFTPQLFGESGLGVVTVVPEYALAPEDPHPAGLNDCLASLRETFQRYPDTPIVLYGDSAGSGMANQVLRHLEAAELTRIRGAVLLEPCLDPAFDSLSSWENREGPGWTRQLAVDSWDAYLGAEAAPWDVHPPVQNLPEYFPPILTFINLADPLRDEAWAWATDLARVGVIVEVHCLPGATHGWLSQPGMQIWERVKAQIQAFFEFFCLPEVPKA